MKKILSSALAALVLISSAYAEKIFVTYDSYGLIDSVEVFREVFNYPLEKGYRAFIYDPTCDYKEQYFPQPEKPTEPSLPPIYPEERYSMSAIALVRRAYETMRDDDFVTAVEVLYHNNETTFYIPEDVYINTAPDICSELVGKSAASLRPGDVINIAVSFSGVIDELNLIARIPVEDIASSDVDYGKNFEALYGTDGYVYWAYQSHPTLELKKPQNNYYHEQYQFGVIRMLRDDCYLISGEDGHWMNLTDVYFKPNTIVYTCDVANKFRCSVSDISAIRESHIPGDCFDDDGNVTSWSKDGDYVYALSRTIAGEAVEIVLFYNFK